MEKVLFNLMLSELVLFTAVLGIFSTIEWYKRLFPHKDRINEYENEVDKYLASDEEELLDEGFIEDMNSYDARITEMKESLKTYNLPPVEVITEEYEKELER